MKETFFDHLAGIAVNLAQELVMLPSESSCAVATDQKNPEQEVAARLVAFCRWRGLDAVLAPALGERCNVVVRLPRPGAPRVLLAGHMDTVSGRGMAAPFSGELRDGRIWGRGACDDKGPLAAAFATVVELAAAGREFFCDLTLVATVDEECSLAGAAALAMEPGAAFDLIVALEPTSLRIVRAHKGDYRARLVTTGRAAHSSKPEQGVNAIARMLAIIGRLDEITAEFGKFPESELGRPTLAVTTISGGSSGNIIPDRCEATVDIRLLPGMAIEEVAARLSEIVAGEGEIEVLFAGKGISTCLDNIFISRFRDAISMNGGDPEPITAMYATDCSRLQERGPCVVWGPGDVAFAHQIDEHVGLEEIASACRMLADFLLAAPE